MRRKRSAWFISKARYAQIMNAKRNARALRAFDLHREDVSGNDPVRSRFIATVVKCKTPTES